MTREQIDSPQGETLKKRFPGEGELVGHVAIRAYYELVGGVDSYHDIEYALHIITQVVDNRLANLGCLKKS